MEQSLESVPTLVPWPTPLTRSLRAKFFITGALLPGSNVIAGLAGESASADSPWQSGNLDVFLTLLLKWPCLAFFVPMILFSIGCLTIWSIRPVSSQWFLIRLGILTGVVLASQFFVSVLGTSSILTLIAAVVVGPGLALAVYLLKLVSRRLQQFSILHLFILMTVCALVLTIGLWINLVSFAESAVMVMFVSAATLNLITYLRVSCAVISENQSVVLNRFNLAGYFSWLASWGICWKFAVDRMMIEYAKLPATDPNCFISGAAAYGHRRFVGTEHVRSPRTAGWTIVAVNRQMQRLKFLEFALVAASPSIHAFVRKYYNCIGPRLAVYCKHNVWVADATFVCLKPLEFISLLLCLVSGVSMDRVKKLYRC